MTNSHFFQNGPNSCETKAWYFARQIFYLNHAIEKHFHGQSVHVLKDYIISCTELVIVIITTIIIINTTTIVIITICQMRQPRL